MKVQSSKFKVQNYNLKFKIIKYFLVLIILNFSFLIFNLNETNAQQVSRSITPLILELVIKPGKSIMIAYNVKNYGDPVILTAKLVNFEPKDNLGNIRLKNDFSGPIRFALDNSDIQLERPFFLKTGASQQLLLRIRAPEGAEGGDYYYTLLTETTPINNVDGTTGSRAKASIGSNILVTVTDSGVIEIKPKVVLFKILNKMNIFGKKINLFDSFDKIPLLFILENKGKNKIVPEGKITLTGPFGEKMNYDIVLKNILSESQRLIEATPSYQLVTNYQQPTTLVLSGFFIGPYHLSTQVTFGENSPTVFANTRFFAFPFKLIVGIIFVITVTVIIIKRFSSQEE